MKLGLSVLAEFHNCDSDLLKNVQQVRDITLLAAKEGNASIVTDFFHQFSPWGVSGVVIVSESHVAVHTWPEYKFLAVDIFTCGTEMEPNKIILSLSKSLQATKVTVKQFDRDVEST